MMSMAPSSPRLPSPPPPAEIQIGPKSPSMDPNAARHAQQIEQTAMDANSKRRIHPGTKAADMAAGPPLIPLHELDSAFQLQEHLAALHYYHTVSNTSPVTRDTAKTLASPPPGTDKTLWLYELCRFLIGQCNSLIVGFLFDTPPCSAATCPEMRASEWQFLCAVHDTPKSCCAIDYCCHTLDWAANVVTNAKIFPSRFVVDSHDKNTALKNLVNVFRRLHRIFAHAWFQHRGVFWSVEGQTGLYVFFKTVCDVYDLLPGENYKLPPEAEGLESTATGVDGGADRNHAPVLLSKPPTQRSELEDDNAYGSAARTNTKRHIKSSPSTGSAVDTVLEADEDGGSSDVTNRLRNMRISGAGPSPDSTTDSTTDEEGVSANIPVIVEHAMVDQPPLRPSSVVPISGLSERESEAMAEREARMEETPAPTPAEAESTSQHQVEEKIDTKTSEVKDSEVQDDAAAAAVEENEPEEESPAAVAQEAREEKEQEPDVTVSSTSTDKDIDANKVNESEVPVVASSDPTPEATLSATDPEPSTDDSGGEEMVLDDNTPSQCADEVPEEFEEADKKDEKSAAAVEDKS
ncbi:Mob1/phocein family protein [Apodospora peruviana]|uniref:Mob1/phocein family protein n=1 Tax=Apodospora peruviana TaxID=516989 RepID=A0AAE0M5D5_9PEZI|nr:Mob1/phocein family protein [Apodospora peruviana]